MDYSGTTVGAFSVSSQLLRMNDARIRELAVYLLKTQKNTSREYGGKYSSWLKVDSPSGVTRLFLL